MGYRSKLFPLEIEDKINIILVINKSITYIKNDTLFSSTKR